MKTKETQYASLLLAMIEKGIVPEKAVANTIRLLHQHKLMALLPRIKKVLMLEVSKQKRKSEAVLVVANASDKAHAEEEAKGAMSACGHRKQPLTVCIDDSIIGGWVVQSYDTRIDASYKRSLRDIYQRAIQ